MQLAKSYTFLLLLLPGIYSCFVTAERKSADYYHKNKTVITEIRNLYDTLYRQQPFSGGFTDRSFSYYMMEVITDTVRYIYNTEDSEEKLYETVRRFNYDTALLRKLGAKMKEIKSLWLGKSTFYIDGKKDTASFLSFKSALIEKPFVENKYYVLIFLHHEINDPEIKARIKKGEFVKVDELVYFTIGSGFR